VKEIQVRSNKGPGLLQRGDNHKKCKNRVESFKNLVNNQKARKIEFYMKAV
jgi:hypothetical protein